MVRTSCFVSRALRSRKPTASRSLLPEAPRRVAPGVHAGLFSFLGAAASSPAVPTESSVLAAFIEVAAEWRSCRHDV